MKKLILMCMAAGAMTFASCTKEDAGTSSESNENDSNTPDHEAGSTAEDSTSTTAYNYDAEYRERATRLASQVSKDLSLDEETQTRIRTVYMNRARQMDELEQRYSSTNASAGMASDSETAMMGNDSMAGGEMTVTGYPDDYPTAYYSELETINSNVDVELKGFLTPQQFQSYQANRAKYYGGEMKYEAANGDKLKVDGDEAKLKAGDTKVKRDGDEAKLKAGDTKIKKEGNETKYKSGDNKIKIED